ncbi:hypothetical protein IW136_004814 [Coemansia sp. RSA 678]|nr:hypothetical protein IW136_004814 [Coemansia sp. RSA 678]
MPSTGPSPLFEPLQASPRLVAQMTGLTLQQSALEVQQQHKLKRMLRRIREARRMRTPRSGRMHVHAKPSMPSLSLPPPKVVVGETGNDDDWSDTHSDIRMVRTPDISMDISDSPSENELQRRVARLITRVFEPRTPLLADHVCVDRLSGAMTNSVYMVTLSAQRPSPLLSKYLLRVYGTGVDELLSREKELYWLAQLTHLGIGPQVFGIFGNGRLEEYLESTTLGRTDIRNGSTSKHIARRMSELHALVSYYRPARTVCGESSGSTGSTGSSALAFESGEPELWANIDSWMLLVRQKWAHIARVCSKSPECSRVLDSWSHIERCVHKLRAHISHTHSPIVFAHADLQYGNILRLKQTGELVVVDFEYAGYNYRGFDIANHFCEWMADYHRPSNPHLLDPSAYPTQEQQRGFLRTYVKSNAFLDANVRATPSVVESDDEGALRGVKLSEERVLEMVVEMEREVRVFVPASHLHWGVWGLVQAASSEIEFDYAGYAAQRLGMFVQLVGEMAEPE